MERRRFLKDSALAVSAAAAGPLIFPSRLFGRFSPFNQVTLGFIGLGGQGSGRNLRGMLKSPHVRVLAVCDCKLSKANEAKTVVEEEYGNGPCSVYQDFREVLARPDIDAVVISTPDHWHVTMALMAIRAGKDVFCEKPTLTIAEGRELTEEVEKRGTVFQWGIEDRYLQKYWMLAGLARTGAIGKVHTVECSLPNKPLFDKEKPAPIPDDLDWNLWLGPAPYAEYTPNITSPARWRQCFDYSGGSLTDWGAHYCDTAQVGIGMEDSGPVEISGSSAVLPRESYVSVPSSYSVQFKYSDGAVIYVHDLTGLKVEGFRLDRYIRFMGTQGWIACTGWDGELTASDMSLFRDRSYAQDDRFWERPKVEQIDFVEAVMNRSRTTYHSEAGHRLSTMLHLGHMAVRHNRSIHWDPAREAFTQNRKELEGSPVYRRPARDWDRHP